MNGAVDTLILGCTHYPLLYDLINDVLNYSVTLIDPGKETAKYLQAFLLSAGLAAETDNRPSYRYYITELTNDFTSVARYFLGEDISDELETYPLESL